MIILQEVVQLREQLPGVGTGKLHHLLTNFLTEHQIKIGRGKVASSAQPTILCE